MFSKLTVPSIPRLSRALLFVGVAATASFPATSYYVDGTGGNDNASGTSTGFAFKSIAKARDAVKTANANMTGDITVYLRGGFHALSSTLALDQTISGTNGFNVIFAAYPNERPVVSGGVPINGWSVHDAGRNIWEAAAPGLDTRQLYVNCVRAVRAHKGFGLPGASQTSTGYTTSDASMQNWRTITDIEFVYNSLQGGSAFVKLKWKGRTWGLKAGSYV